MMRSLSIGEFDNLVDKLEDELALWRTGKVYVFWRVKAPLDWPRGEEWPLDVMKYFSRQCAQRRAKANGGGRIYRVTVRPKRVAL